VNICLRWREPIRRARLHFNKAKRIAVVSDQIDLAIDHGADAVSSDGNGDVCRHYSKPQLLQVGGCQFFATTAKLEMSDRLCCGSWLHRGHEFLIAGVPPAMSAAGANKFVRHALIILVGTCDV